MQHKMNGTASQNAGSAQNINHLSKSDGTFVTGVRESSKERKDAPPVNVDVEGPLVNLF